MEKTTDIAALGELLIDFTPAGMSPAGMALFERNPGGAPANVAVAGARFGLSTAFIGKVGADGHGRFLREALRHEGVDVRGLVTDAVCPTTLAFVELDANGERGFSFVRRGSADVMLTAAELDTELIRTSKILHVGTLSLTDEPSRSAQMRALELARVCGTEISCDVNWRAPLWSDSADFVRRTEEILPYVDLLKLTQEEAAILTGENDCKKAASLLAGRFGIKTVAVTLGERGAYADGEEAPAFAARVTDTTGAGDCFWAAYLYARLKGRADALRFACAAASLCVERRGAMPAMPTAEETEQRLRAREFGAERG